MANVKITDLTAYTDPLNTDVLAIVDVTNNVTKKVSIANMAKNVSLGTAALPGVAFDGDPNTGIYSPGADQIGISTGGTGRVFVDASGNVGVNTASAIAPGGFGYAREFALTGSTSGDSSVSINLRGSRTVAGGFGDINFWHQSTSNRAYIQARRGASDSAIDLDFITSGGAGMRLTSAGLLGLGTSSPATTLHVVGSSTLAGNVDVGTTASAAIIQFPAITGWGPRIGQGTSSINALSFYTNNIEHVTIDSSGRLGIGTTGPSRTLDVVGTGIYTAFTGNTGATFNIVPAANGQDGVSFVHSYQTGTGYGPLKFEINGEKMRLDSSGRLLVGTSTSTADATLVLMKHSGDANGPGILHMSNPNSAPTSGSALGLIRFSNSTQNTFASIEGWADANSGSGDYPGRLVFSTTPDGSASPTERMRITQQGFAKHSSTNSYAGATGTYHEFRSGEGGDAIMVFHNTAASVTGTIGGVLVKYTASSPNDTSKYLLYCEDSTALRAGFRSNGGLANYSANNANLSDRNAKKDISLAADTWSCVKEWEIVNYRYKDQPEDADLNLGVIAQQVAESCPEVITVFQEAKEATETEPAQEERLGVKEQQMYWMAIKALQEAMERIEALEADVAALKGA